MSQPKHKSEAPTSDADVRRRSGTRRIEGADPSDPVSVPRAPRLPSVAYPSGIDQDHVQTQPEHEPPSTDALTLPAPPSRAAIPTPDDDDDRDTIPSPAPD